MTLALAASAQAAGNIRVCINSNPYISASVVNRAEAIASRMFVSAGVALEWRSAASAGCHGLQQMKTVNLDLVINTPSGNHPGAMAYTRLYEGAHIVVLYDRIVLGKITEEAPQASSLLAHVMTHEITHLLQGIERHSQTGVMKAHWDARDLLQMARAPLLFDPEDVDLIQRGLHPGAAGADSAVPSPTTAVLH
jgi:hypothetical protein